MSLTIKPTPIICCLDTRIGQVIYYDDSDKIKKSNRNEEYDGHMEILPRNSIISQENENIFICGSSGSGKTYYIRQYATNYKLINPNNRIYMITQSSEHNLPKSCRVFTDDLRHTGKTYAEYLNIDYINAYEYFNKKEVDMPDKSKYKNIEIFEKDLKKYEDDVKKMNIDITRDYSNCLIIFDDFIYMTGKNPKETKLMRENIINMILQILNLGRKISVSCMITSHLLYERRYNDLFQNIYSEINKFVFSPSNINKRQLSYVLKSYFGFRTEDIRHINGFDAKTHMLTYNKKPSFIMSENKIELFELD